MSADGRVALRLAGLCLDRRGRLSPLLICSAAVRAGLLVDLALGGRLGEDDDGIDLDASPTGHRPTDLLLHEVVAHPGTSLDGWLDRPRPTLRDIAQDAVASGRWLLRPGLHLGPRFRIADGALPDLDPVAGAAVTVLAAAAGLAHDQGQADRSSGIGAASSSELLDSTGPHRWLVAALSDHLQRLVDLYAIQAGILPGAAYIPPA